MTKTAFRPLSQLSRPAAAIPQRRVVPMQSPSALFAMPPAMSPITGNSPSEDIVLDATRKARIMGDCIDIQRHFMNDDLQIRPRPASEWQSLDPVSLRVWASVNARYFIPTTETLAWLTEIIAGRTALEIGAGMGDTGRLLGIPMSDSYIQQTPLVKREYERLGALHQPTNPPRDVEKAEAQEAVRRHQPQVVIGAWITERFKHGFHGPSSKAFMYGVNEEKLLASGIETYIVLGNKGTHADKAILREEHERHVLPGHVSRAMNQDDNIIYVWNRKSA